jgi:hypothetical protein
LARYNYEGENERKIENNETARNDAMRAGWVDYKPWKTHLALTLAVTVDVFENVAKT